MNKETCPICNEGTLSNADTTHEVKHNDKIGAVKLHMSICNHCHCEQASPTQVNNNLLEVKAFKESQQ